MRCQGVNDAYLSRLQAVHVFERMIRDYIGLFIGLCRYRIHVNAGVGAGPSGAHAIAHFANRIF